MTRNVSTNKGKFIVLEGIECAGKTTLCRIIAQELEKLHFNFISVREPGGTQLGECVRELIKYGQHVSPLHQKTELLLLYAARVQLVEFVIQPALAQGNWVISDRYELSTQAYQGAGRGINQELLVMLRRNFLDNFAPDLTFYIDITATQALERLSKRGVNLDYFESQGLHFLERVRLRYLEMVEHNPKVAVINGSKTLNEVCLSVQQAFQKWLLNLA